MLHVPVFQTKQQVLFKWWRINQTAHNPKGNVKISPNFLYNILDGELTIVPCLWGKCYLQNETSSGQRCRAWKWRHVLQLGILIFWHPFLCPCCSLSTNLEQWQPGFLHHHNKLETELHKAASLVKLGSCTRRTRHFCCVFSGCQMPEGQIWG